MAQQTSQASGIIRTKMAAAFHAMLVDCRERGKNSGRIGRRVLTNEARFVGVKYVPKSKADSAERKVA
jgi:hypothetical protein